MRTLAAWTAVAAAMVGVGSGCGAPRVGDPVDLPLAAAGTFRSIQQGILAPRCAEAGCHQGSPPPRAPMSLEPALAYDALVGRPALQVPSLFRVEPGDPERSYLVLKLRGTAGTVDGVATRMPLGREPLDDAAMEEIMSWIASGAPND